MLNSNLTINNQLGSMVYVCKNSFTDTFRKIIFEQRSERLVTAA